MVSELVPSDRQPTTGWPVLTSMFVVVLTTLLNGVLLVMWWATSDQIAAEGNVVENLQVVLLAAAVFFFGRCARREEPPVRVFATFMCIATFYLLVRELDFRALPGPEWMQWLSSKTPRRVAQIVILLGLLIYATLRARRLLEALRTLRPAQLWIYSGTGFLFAVAKLTEEISRVDKNPIGDFALPHGQFWEELLELNADMMLLVAALAICGVLSSQAKGRVRSSHSG